MFGPLVPEFYALIAIFVIALYWYSTRNHGYWKKAGIPYVKPWPAIGSFIINLNKPLHESELERYQKYGRVYGYFEGNCPILTVCDPELLKDIFLKDFHSFPIRRIMNTNDPMRENMLNAISGEQWRRIRSIVTRTFQPGSLKRMISAFDECANDLCKKLLKAAKREESIDAKTLFSVFALDSIMRSGFSTKLDLKDEKNNQFLRAARTGFNNSINFKYIVRTLMPSLSRLLGFAMIEAKPTNFFKEISLKFIEERKRTKQTHKDYLQLLLDASKKIEYEGEATDESYHIDMNYEKEGDLQHIIKNDYKQQPLTMTEILAQCIVILLAAHDSPTVSLSTLAYHIAEAPHVQEKLIAEIDEAIQKYQGELTYEAIQKMKYMDNVISENLRMHPPVIKMERIAAEDYTLGDGKIKIPKGMQIACPISAIHRDPEYYPNPEIFDPDRFCYEERMRRPAFTFMPFGGGPRNCPAIRYSLLLMKTCLAHILSRFRLRLAPEMKLPLEFDVNVFITQPKNLILRVELRDDIPDMQN